MNKQTRQEVFENLDAVDAHIGEQIECIKTALAHVSGCNAEVLVHVVGSLQCCRFAMESVLDTYGDVDPDRGAL